MEPINAAEARGAGLSLSMSMADHVDRGPRLPRTHLCPQPSAGPRFRRGIALRSMLQLAPTLPGVRHPPSSHCYRYCYCHCYHNRLCCLRGSTGRGGGQPCFLPRPRGLASQEGGRGWRLQGVPALWRWYQGRILHPEAMRAVSPVGTFVKV